MKKIVRLAGMCLACFILLGVVSCGSKVNKEELDKKVEAYFNSDKEQEFTEAEYEFMADYLLDNFDKLQKMDFNDKEVEIATGYSFVLMGAQMQLKLSDKVQKKIKKLYEKGEAAGAFGNYEETEKAIMDELQKMDLDWENEYQDWGDDSVVEEVVETVEG